MSENFKNQDLNEIAQQAERDLNSNAAKTGHSAESGKGNTTGQGGQGSGVSGPAGGQSSGASDSTLESGVDDSVEQKFPGSEVVYGSAASGQGDNRDIPESEGGGVNPATGQTYKARDFDGPGGPEDKAAIEAEVNPGSDDVQGNTRER
ncbi:hypothetical protein BDY17DRAFT_299173 [Neohortaea acidophila]|uniref:Uncharacterized protein n=1 Tax=Neohortaea acidophila TaxID=245834 RepID=A0A6A6PSY2_9PEZI|nr:uncharacterized protein BDY17DRAFT_299173 [Neohortaea acidophila]KAF2482791.1 hypothetical protein BDY17DRAFT_299173 [Neohortaea acidophila]